jgi:hypothetical protein
MLHLTHPLVPRPSILSGVTSLKEDYDRSNTRTERVLQDLPEPIPVVKLFHGDAVYHPSESTRDHPLNPAPECPPLTAVLALDCAYHFKTRRMFLTQCRRKLVPGGRIGLADLCFDSPSLRGWQTYLVSLIGIMPRSNMIRLDEYIQMMEDIGFVNVKLTDISDDVFPGFLAFLKSRGRAWPLFVAAMELLVRMGLKFVIVSAGTPVNY